MPAIKEASDLLQPDEKEKFLLTGSADIFRSARTQEALPGHMARLELFPLSLSELSSQSINIVDFLLTAEFQAKIASFCFTQAKSSYLFVLGILNFMRFPSDYC
ncbi:hypothetical protein WDW89_02090 [Deltaproteobacteria bacterium TL4]